MIIILLTAMAFPAAFSTAERWQNPLSYDYVAASLRMELGVVQETRSSTTYEYRDVLLHFADELSPHELSSIQDSGVDFLHRGGEPIHVGGFYRARIDRLESLRAARDFGLLRVSSGSKQFYPSLASSVPATRAPDVWNNLNTDGVAIDGNGTLVAVIDTGASWLHPSFWRVTGGPYEVIQDGSHFYVDLNGDGEPGVGEGPIRVVHAQNPSTIEASNEYLYIDVNNNGVFDYGDGDRWLCGVDSNQDGIIDLPSEDVVLLNESKVSLFYDQYSGDVYQRGVNLTSGALSVGDTHGHGTHVASTIAGGQPGYSQMLGAAPGADLIIVRSPLQSSDIIDGIHFALANDADVINMSFSSFLGFMDGTDVEDLAVNEALRRYGTISTLAAGNLAGRSKHASFTVTGGGNGSAMFSVQNPPDYSFLNILWHSADRDEEIVLTTPGDEEINLGRFSDIDGMSYELVESEIRAYIFPDTSIRGTNQIIIQVSDEEHRWDSGIWQLTVINSAGEPVRVDAYAWDNSWDGSNLRFTSQIDNSRTVSSPGTADLGITVAAYDESTEQISSSSGRGPRIDGVPKPDVAAPGASILAARNSISSLWFSRSGTSMAAPHVAGLVALLQQTSSDESGWEALSSLLQGAGDTKTHHSPPDDRWGYGLSDALSAVRHLLPLSANPSLPSQGWVGIEEIYSGNPEDGIDGELDIVSVLGYLNTTALSLAVETAQPPDFSGTNTLLLGWDSDGNPATGDNGVDYRVEVTGGTSQVYEWTGSAFEESSIPTLAWSIGNTQYISLENPSATPARNLSVSTLNTSGLQDWTGWLSLQYRWRPVVSDFSLAVSGSGYLASFSLQDWDSDASVLSVGWALSDGSFNALRSNTVMGTNSISLEGDYSEEDTSEAFSFMLNVSDSDSVLYLPPVMLVSAGATSIQFSNTSLLTNEIRVGPFFSGVIRGSFSLDGYQLVEEIEVSFVNEFGFALNFSVQGSNGDYWFEISASGFTAGVYDVYAVARIGTGQRYEHKFGTLAVIQDYSALTSLLLVVGAGIVIIVVIRRVISPSHKELSS